MINDLKKDAEQRMEKTLDALQTTFARIRTGRAHPSLLESIQVDYYGNSTPLSQVANITVTDSRTLSISPWERGMVKDIERAIMNSGLGLNPASAGEVIRVPMPALTEETRKGYTRQARNEAENARISIRNVRRDVLSDVKDLLKAKDISEDDERQAQGEVQKITDRFIAKIDGVLATKEKDLMEI
ncbi:MAG: ribosome recycling factor [Porticoccaceae bacterium]|nr:ribosome recycling factor [Porticoccaceae bacterium]